MHRFFSQVVTAETNAGLRVHFRELNLGARSYVQLTSLKDSLTQRLEVANMANWFQTSAAFNGDRVLLELFVAPGESGIRAVVDHLVLPCNCPPPSPEVVPIRIENLCGPDDRAASGDLRIGRTSRGCTAWLISNGAVLSAGHCVPNGAMFMINVPPSNADGVTANSHPDDQYPIVPDSEVMVWDQNSSSTAGDDIDDVIFRLNPDNRGRRAHDRLGLFRVTTAVPPNGTVIRITGYGTDSTPPGPMGGANAQNQTLQTSTGGFVGQFELGVNGTGRILRHAYAVDTESGNSGSPIMWDAKGFTIVIHTAGGCASDGSGSNGGTSFNQPNLRAAVENFPGANTRYPDTVIYPGSPADIGSIFAPDHNLRAAYNRTPSGGIISIVQGAYPRTVIGNTGIFGDDGKSVRIEAPVGPFTIGQ
jgi:V8-like Glu-specific endopeptidase